MPSTSVQISLSGAVPPASKRPTTVQRYAPNLIVWPVAQSLKRLETLFETMTSDLPGADTGIVRTGAAMASMAGLLSWTAWEHLTGRRRWDEPPGVPPSSP